jgi:tripartite ATP-independent transporter DctP family solute receptor
MKKCTSFFLAAGLLVCSLTAVYAGGQGDAAKGPASLKLGSSMADGTVEVASAKQFAKLLDEYSRGGIKCDVLAGGLAGGEREIVEGQQLGTMDMSVVSGILQNFDPAMMIMEYDLLFVNEDHVRKVFYGPVGQKIFDRLLQKTRIRILSTFMRTPRLMTTTRAVNSIQDLKGLKLRVPEMKARTALWAALGASPTPMAFPEVYTALQTKTIDGQENPITAIVSSKFYEVCDYLAITNHVYGFMFLNIADAKFQSFTGEQKEWINKAAAEAAVFNDKLVKEQEQKEMDIATSRMNVTRPDTSSWRELTKDVYKQFLDVEGFQELYLAIIEAGKEFEKK